MRARDVPWPALCLLGAALIAAAVGRPTTALLLGVLAGARATVAAFPAAERALEQSLRAAGRAAGALIEWVLLTVVAIAILVPIAAARRVLHRNPLTEHRSPSWIPVDRSPMPSRAAVGRSTRAEQVGRAARIGVTVVAIAVLAAGLQDRVGAIRGPDPFEPGQPARAEQPQGELLDAEQGRVYADLRPDPQLGWTLPDRFDGEVVNVRDGHRVSTGSVPGTPLIWFFGGSALWGSAQRDAHTIPSAVAGAAAQTGSPVRVVNFGVFGYTSVQEVGAFERALQRSDPPDIAVFYHGFNDLTVGAGALFAGVPPGSQVLAPLPPLRGSRVAWRSPRAPIHRITIDSVVRSVLAAHERSMARAERLARDHGVRLIWFWQPSAFTTSSTVPGSLTGLGYSEATWRSMAALHRSTANALPPSTVDLTDALRGRADVFVDPVHTNELGAAVVGRALWRHLQPEIIRVHR